MLKKVYIVLSFIIILGSSASSSLAGNIVIKGSTTVLPIAQKVAEAYMKQNPDVKISLSGGGSGNGIKALIDGSTDIADSSRFIKPKEVKLAVEKGRYPVPFAVAYDCIVPVVHPGNPLKNISMAQLKGMLGQPGLILVDVRRSVDWNASGRKIKGAVREDPQAVAKWVGKYPKGKTMVFY